MKAIGLTGGAFCHFPSKDDLFTAIVERELSRSLIGQVAQGEGFDQARLQRCLGTT